MFALKSSNAETGPGAAWSRIILVEPESQRVLAFAISIPKLMLDRKKDN
jgi:hypothetical protein